MIVKKREWISEDAREAILYIGDFGFECAAFSHPCNFGVGDELAEPLFALNVNGIMKIQRDAQLMIVRQNESFAHDIVAVVVDYGRRLVDVGSIKIELDIPLPCDIAAGDVVQFSCGRLDVIA